tara:strand:- start:993 stop:1520 length:528 start_codon:yes stop_codon:yes gene_type:complete
MEKIIIYVNGKDRIGIISDITKEISDLNGNIETSKMIKLEQDFNVLMLISINKENIEQLTKKLYSYNDLDILVKKTSNKNGSAKNKYIFILKGADTEGIVHQCTQLFSKLKINITDLETQLMNAPVTGSPLFYIKAIISIPKSESMEMIKDAINQLEVEENVKIKFDAYNPDLNH